MSEDRHYDSDVLDAEFARAQHLAWADNHPDLMAGLVADPPTHVVVLVAEHEALMKVAYGAKEFIDDWTKGDFSLSTIAALDAQSLQEALERLGVALAATQAATDRDGTKS